jgi:translocation and assembly module TamA
MKCCSSRRRGAALAAVASLAVTPWGLAGARAQTPPVAEPALDPDSPLDEMPDIGVDWPDLNAAQEEEASPTGAAGQTEAGDELRYTLRFEGLEIADREALASQFDALSVLRAGEKAPANVAQLDRRAREDANLLAELLRARGYYDATVDTRVVPEAGGLAVVLAAAPGEQYRFTGVEVRGLPEAQATPLREAFGIKPQDPVDAARVQAGEAALKARIGEAGFPFAQVPESEVVVDHASRTATLVLSVEPGGLKRYGRIVVPEGALFDAKHLAEIARFKPGQPYEAKDVDDLRRALIATGLASAVTVRPVPGATPETVDIAVTVERAPPRTIAGELGYGTGEGIRGEVSWQHRNLLPPEGGVTVRGVAGTQEFLLGANYRRNNFRKRDHVLTAQASISRVNRKAFEARTFLLGGGIERQTNIIFQKKWTWSAGVDLLATDERDNSRIISDRRRTFFIAALPTSLSYDGSDNLLDPTRGFRVSGRLSPELSLQNGVFGYARVQLDASAYRPVSDRVVLAGRVRIGHIAGASASRIAPSRRFYAGGGGSVRGYGFQAIGPRDANNDPIGGRSLAEFGLEARVRFGNFGIVPFLDGGNIYRSALPGLSNMRFGAGIGARYYTNFGPIRVDVGTPLNPQRGDPKLAVYVSLGQAF